jgi:hypothetical protein
MDWNGTFQDILWVNEGDDRSLIDRYHALKDLAHDFNHAARTYATIIIEGSHSVPSIKCAAAAAPRI